MAAGQVRSSGAAPQLRVEGVAPRDPIVTVAELEQARVVASVAEGLPSARFGARFCSTVPQVSTIGIVRSGRWRWTPPTKRAIRS